MAALEAADSPADVVIVYTRDAYDREPEDREAAALTIDTRFPVLVDDDSVGEAYNAHPTRCFYVVGGKIVYSSPPYVGIDRCLELSNR